MAGVPEWGDAGFFLSFLLGGVRRQEEKVLKGERGDRVGQWNPMGPCGVSPEMMCG